VKDVAAEAGGVDVGPVEGAQGRTKPGTEIVGGVARGGGRYGEVDEGGGATCSPRGEDALDDLGDEGGIGGLDGDASGHVAGAAPGVVGARVGAEDGGAAFEADGGVGLEERDAIG
jgi:hypothetical protein